MFYNEYKIFKVNLEQILNFFFDIFILPFVLFYLLLQFDYKLGIS